MSNSPAKQRVGGEYGAVRANIDVPKLEAYLAKNVKGLQPPLDVKQFKVSSNYTLRGIELIFLFIQFGQVRLMLLAALRLPRTDV